MKLIKLKFPKVYYVNKNYIKEYKNTSKNIPTNINKSLNITISNNSNFSERNFSIFILTYNVCGMSLNDINSVNFSELLFPEKAQKYFDSNYNINQYPIFYLIGLEEVVNLNAKNVIIGGERQKYSLWEDKITIELKSRNNYILLSKSSLVGILFFLFVQSSEMSKISNLKITKTKTGFYGQLGNKGSCFIEFEYENKKYGFNIGHLSSGEKVKNNNERKDSLIKILNHKSNKDSTLFYQNDFYFILGDLNFRVNNNIKLIHKWLFNLKFVGNQSLKEENKIENKDQSKNNSYNINKINNNNINMGLNHTSNYSMTENIITDKNEEQLDSIFYQIDENIFMKYFGDDYLKFDQLNIFKGELTKYNIKESNISFFPTYKYLKKSNNYNIFKREPAWTDRILFKENSSIKSILYDRINVDYSDHKPVFSLFEINY